MPFPGIAFFIILAVLQFFVVADNLVSLLHLDEMLAVQIAAFLSGLPLFACYHLMRHDTDTEI
ncbi:hypothetical protein [Ferrovibrio sp.]|uniref:hypothetical protein n=1 Tax=Ferrovibrio sp. TaxID=1917215 RepID=UPI00311FA167